MCEAVIAAATPLQRMIAETIRRHHGTGYTIETLAPKIDAWFPEASDDDKAAAVEIAASYALLVLRAPSEPPQDARNKQEAS
jgi:hypothetical protein